MLVGHSRPPALPLRKPLFSERYRLYWSRRFGTRVPNTKPSPIASESIRMSASPVTRETSHSLLAASRLIPPQFLRNLRKRTCRRHRGCSLPCRQLHVPRVVYAEDAVKDFVRGPGPCGFGGPSSSSVAICRGPRFSGVTMARRWPAWQAGPPPFHPNCGPEARDSEEPPHRSRNLDRCSEAPCLSLLRSMFFVRKRRVFTHASVKPSRSRFRRWSGPAWRAVGMPVDNPAAAPPQRAAECASLLDRLPAARDCGWVRKATQCSFPQYW